MMNFVKEHIENCPTCREKYLKIKNTISNIINNDSKDYMTKQYQDFKVNLSAYIDNELDDAENIKIKKTAISNPLARQDLENIYSFKKLLHNSFEKTKTDFKNDFSKQIMNQILEENSPNYNSQFYKLLTIFSIIITTLVIGLIYVLYF